MILLLWAALFFVIAIVLGFVAFGGIAVAISFFTKILLLLSLICFIVAFVLVVVEKFEARQKKAHQM